LVAVGAISACGGGGGSSGSGGNAPAGGSSSFAPPSPSPSATATVSVDTNQVSVTADLSDPTPAPAIVKLTVVNAPSADLAYKVVFSGSAIASSAFTWQSTAQGQLTIVFPQPSSLGVGTYNGLVTLSVCDDSACATPVAGSPLTVAVTLSVTDASAASFTVQTRMAGFEAHTADPNPPSATFNVFLQNVPAAGLYILPSQPSSGFITGVDYTQSVDSMGQVTVAIALALVKPSALGSGFFQNSVTFKVCYDMACQHQLPGSPATEPIYYRVYLTEGVEYSLRTVNAGGVSDLAYDAVGAKLYVSGLSGYSTPFSSAVTQLDPVSGAVGTQATLADSLFGIATSDDGSYVYVGSTTNPVVHRLTIPSLSPDIDIALGSSGDPNTGGGANIVSELAVAPGAPHTVAVSLAHPGSLYTGGTVIFDDATARVQMLSPLGYYAEPDAIAWGSSATSLYASRYSSALPLEVDIASVAVGSNGLTVTNSVSLDPAIYAFGRQFCGAGRAYDQVGHVVDVTNGAALGQIMFPVTNYIVTLLPDPAHGRVFVLQTYIEENRLFLLSYDASTFALQSVADLGVDNFDVALKTHLISWGTDGIAFNRNGIQILSGTFYAAPTSPSASSAGAHVHKASAMKLSAVGVPLKPLRVDSAHVR